MWGFERLTWILTMWLMVSVTSVIGFAKFTIGKLTNKNPIVQSRISKFVTSIVYMHVHTNQHL